MRTAPARPARGGALLRGRVAAPAGLAALDVLVRFGVTTSTWSCEQIGQLARKRLWRQNVGTGDRDSV